MEKKTLFLIYCIFRVLTSFGTNYYVSNTGNDKNNGLSITKSWQTISKLNATAFKAGDSILFERGGSWRKELLIQQSGTAKNYIIYAAFGSGNKPRILGSNKAENWTKVETNIWKPESSLGAPRTCTGNSTTNHPSSIFFEEKDGSITWGNMEEIHLNSEGAPKDICERDRDKGFTLMDKEYDWCWEDDRIFVYSMQNPGEKYLYIHVPQRESTIRMASHKAQEYIKIENLEMLYAIKHGIDCEWPMAYEKRGFEVKNCHIGWMGTKGAASAMGIQLWHSDVLIQGNDINDCGRRNISYNVYSDTRKSSLTFENVVFDNNKLHNWYHTTGIDINGGYNDDFKNFIIKKIQFGMILTIILKIVQMILPVWDYT